MRCSPSNVEIPSGSDKSAATEASVPVVTTKTMLTGYEIHGKLRAIEKALNWSLSRWMSEMLELKSEQSNCSIRLNFKIRIRTLVPIALVILSKLIS